MKGKFLAIVLIAVSSVFASDSLTEIELLLGLNDIDYPVSDSVWFEFGLGSNELSEKDLDKAENLKKWLAENSDYEIKGIYADADSSFWVRKQKEYFLEEKEYSEKVDYEAGINLPIKIDSVGRPIEFEEYTLAGQMEMSQAKYVLKSKTVVNHDKQEESLVKDGGVMIIRAQNVAHALGLKKFIFGFLTGHDRRSVLVEIGRKETTREDIRIIKSDLNTLDRRINSMRFVYPRVGASYIYYKGKYEGKKYSDHACLPTSALRLKISEKWSFSSIGAFAPVGESPVFKEHVSVGHLETMFHYSLNQRFNVVVGYALTSTFFDDFTWHWREDAGMLGGECEIFRIKKFASAKLAAKVLFSEMRMGMAVNLLFEF